MSFSDPVADLIIRLKNSSVAQHKFVDIRYSKLAVNILSLLKYKGFVLDFVTDGKHQNIRVFLRFIKKRVPVIKGVKRISKPSCRVYSKAANMFDHCRHTGILGFVVVSTSKGIMEFSRAKKENLGGELLFAIW